MRLRTLAVLILFLTLMSPTQAQTKSIAERLGYPPNAKLLIVHADDLAVAHSVDAASFEALDKNAVTSASVLVPCPWLNEVAAYAKEHPGADRGLHLALTAGARSKQKTKCPVCLILQATCGQKRGPPRRTSRLRKSSESFARRSIERSLWAFIRRTSTTTWVSFSRGPISLRCSQNWRTNTTCHFLRRTFLVTRSSL